MSRKRLEWKVGLFVLVGLVLLGALMIRFSKGTSFYKSTYNILLRAGNVGGLKTKAAVLMAGVQVGTIDQIDLGPAGTNVTITLKIYSTYQIHNDAHFSIEQAGFLGDQFVAITPTKNEGPALRNNDTAEADAPFNLAEVAKAAGGFLQRVDETAKRLNDAVSDLRRLLLNEQTLTNLSSAVLTLRGASERAVSTIDGLNGIIATNGPALAIAATNLINFSTNINHFASSLQTLVDTNSADIHNAVKNLESSTETLKTMMNDAHEGKGLVGALIKNPEMAENVSLIASNLSVTSSNLNRLGLWGILWQHKPAKTKSSTMPSKTSPKESK
jgi:phospholipid/cholesterol/gamma-HCH transport system substrate-binding protein